MSVDLEDRWLSGFTLGEQLRTGCTYEEAVRRAVAFRERQQAMADAETCSLAELEAAAELYDRLKERDQ